MQMANATIAELPANARSLVTVAQNPKVVKALADKPKAKAVVVRKEQKLVELNLKSKQAFHSEVVLKDKNTTFGTTSFFA